MRAFGSVVVFVMALVSLTPAAIEQDKGGQEEFGHYEIVPNWPQPLPDGPDGVKHEGWTWGSFGAVLRNARPDLDRATWRIAAPRRLNHDPGLAADAVALTPPATRMP